MKIHPLHVTRAQAGSWASQLRRSQHGVAGIVPGADHIADCTLGGYDIPGADGVNTCSSSSALRYAAAGNRNPGGRSVILHSPPACLQRSYSHRRCIVGAGCGKLHLAIGIILRIGRRRADAYVLECALRRIAAGKNNEGESSKEEDGDNMDEAHGNLLLQSNPGIRNKFRATRSFRVTCAVPVLPQACNLRDKAPRSGRGLRHRSRCASQLHRAKPGEPCAARAMT